MFFWFSKKKWLFRCRLSFSFFSLFLSLSLNPRSLSFPYFFYNVSHLVLDQHTRSLPPSLSASYSPYSHPSLPPPDSSGASVSHAGFSSSSSSSSSSGPKSSSHLPSLMRSTSFPSSSMR